MGENEPMSDERNMKPEDAALWAKVAASVDERFADKPDAQAFARMARQVTARKKPPATPPKVAAPVPPPRPASPKRPGPGGLDRRTRQKMLRGNVAIEATLDLHGLSVREAHAELRAFLVSCRRRGLRTVRVVTGKGAAPFVRHTLHGYEARHDAAHTGKLRRLLPEWLHEPDIAPHVAGFAPAHPRHGGGGAWYVRLRRRERGVAP